MLGAGVRGVPVAARLTGRSARSLGRRISRLATGTSRCRSRGGLRRAGRELLSRAGRTTWSRGRAVVSTVSQPSPGTEYEEDGGGEREQAPKPVHPCGQRASWFQNRAHRPTLTPQRPPLWQHSRDMPASILLEPILARYVRHARALPWRQSDISAWQILVSEVMLQQTPVSRVLTPYAAWVRRWPTPAALARDSPGEAVRMWGRLGYPRRALRLHEAATAIVRNHDGAVPSTYEGLRLLPGVGDYTAAAVAAFAYQQRTVVLDTNVRRVLARVFTGQEQPRSAVGSAERQLASSVLPDDGATAAAWNVAVMELGATVCTARSPRCSDCPVSGSCAWRKAGFPKSDRPAARPQRYIGTDRQCRDRILAELRGTAAPLPAASVADVWSDRAQCERALQSLLDDGLVVEQHGGALSLPGGATSARAAPAEFS